MYHQRGFISIRNRENVRNDLKRANDILSPFFRSFFLTSVLPFNRVAMSVESSNISLKKRQEKRIRRIKFNRTNRFVQISTSRVTKYREVSEETAERCVHRV